MTKTIFIIAGEASGDLLGAALMRAMTEGTRFVGIGGDRMTQQGLTSLFPMQDLSVMGVAEVIRHLPRLLRRIRQTIKAIINTQPDLIVTIDSPDFVFRVARAVKKKAPHLKIVHYVAPTVWAWRPGRAKKIAAFLDGLMCLFPFEPPYFTKHGLKAAFVGHPLAAMITPPADADKTAFFLRYGLDAAKPILCVLPGSRTREIDNLWPVFLETIQRIKRYKPDLQIVVPTLPHVVDTLQSGDGSLVMITDHADKYTAMHIAQAALHASGTVALELALCGTPMVTAYRVSPLSAWIARKMLTTRYVNLVNILLNRPVVPEILQDDVTAETLAPLVQGLLSNAVLHDLQQQDLQQVRHQLQPPQIDAAAAFVQTFL